MASSRGEGGSSGDDQANAAARDHAALVATSLNVTDDDYIEETRSHAD